MSLREDRMTKVLDEIKKRKALEKMMERAKLGGQMPVPTSVPSAQGLPPSVGSAQKKPSIWAEALDRPEISNLIGALVTKAFGGDPGTTYKMMDKEHERKLERQAQEEERKFLKELERERAMREEARERKAADERREREATRKAEREQEMKLEEERRMDELELKQAAMTDAERRALEQYQRESEREDIRDSKKLWEDRHSRTQEQALRIKDREDDRAFTREIVQKEIDAGKYDRERRRGFLSEIAEAESPEIALQAAQATAIEMLKTDPEYRAMEQAASFAGQTNPEVIERLRARIQAKAQELLEAGNPQFASVLKQRMRQEQAGEQTLEMLLKSSQNRQQQRAKESEEERKKRLMRAAIPPGMFGGRI